MLTKAGFGARFAIILTLIAGMLGVQPARPVLADTLIVTNTNDGGAGSLRAAIEAASEGDTITFDSSLAEGTIGLGSQLTIDKDLTIDASGLSSPLTLSGGNLTRIMDVVFPAEVSVTGLIFTEGVINNGNGGAVHATGAFIATNSTFIKNTASDDGGAIWGGQITLTDTTLSENKAGGNGGAIHGVELTIRNTTIDHNEASYEGGGIAITGNRSSTIVNSTVTQNLAGDSGGGIYSNGNNIIDIYNSTFAQNTAVNGHEYILLGTTTVSLVNTIFVCTGENENECYIQVQGSSVAPSHSTLGAGSLLEYGLAELADNGGPTQTMALLPGSPLIDMGADAACASAPVNNLDQRGMTRPHGTHCDIGAYEDQSIVLFVKQDATGANNGTSWADAYTDLQTALTAVSPDDEIWVAAGMYKPTSGTDRTISFVLKNDVALYGGFAGTETERTQRDPEINVTTLSGDIGVAADNSDNSYHVVVGSNTNASAILDGFTITAGNANDTASSLHYYGGGLYINKGSPQLNEVIFIDNQAGFGGGIYASHTEVNDIALDLILTNVVFKDNSALGEGGGMATLFRPDLSSASFRLSLTDVVFENNIAVRTGGGLVNNGPELELMDVTFSGNTAAGGGGLSNIPIGPSVFTNVTFHNNFASDGGGGMLVGSSSPMQTTLTNVTFSNNSTDMNGGGIANAASSNLLLTNVTFSGNTAGVNGGGISNGGFFDIEGGGTINLINTTFSNNAANSNGGAIYSESGEINVYNSILYGDTGGEIFDNAGTAVVTYSVIQGGYAGIGNLDEDPRLGPLQDNGGLTQTMALGADSPAIDAGDNVNCPDTDQRGVTRPQGAHCDIGAYEFDGPSNSIGVVIGDSPEVSYPATPHQTRRESFAGVNDGPVRITNPGSLPLLAAERVIYKVKNVTTSFSEMMALPNSQLDNMYWLPWYNNGKDLDTQLRFANVTDQTATVHVFIGDQEMTPAEGITLQAGESERVSYPGINDGPVQIVSDQNLVAAERLIYKVRGVNTSFSEMMALPNSQLDNTYWLPWYNNNGKDLDTQLRVANVTDEAATIHILIGDTEVTPTEGITLPAGESTRVSYPGINDGPVQIVSDQNIVAAERVIYKVKGVNTSFSEMMALPEKQLDTTYWFPWYNNATADLDTQIRFANVTDQDTNVRVYIGDQEVQGSPFPLQAGESTRMSFPNINTGPLRIESDVSSIVAAIRVIYKLNNIPTSFSEMMGMPKGSLDATYWFPWYNNVGLDTQLRFGMP